MAEAIIFPNIEKLLGNYLRPLAGGVSVVTKVPTQRPVSFVKLTRVGGPRRDLVTDSPMVVVECWAGTDYEAGELGRLIQAHAFALYQTETPDGYVRAVREVAGLQSFPDPLSGSPRYQFTVQYDTRGVPVA